jgi:hypothetical protein
MAASFDQSPSRHPAPIRDFPVLRESADPFFGRRGLLGDMVCVDAHLDT